jgi:predicted esterase
MITQHIVISQKARVVSVGEETSNIEKIWLVLHGYGQLARYFALKFEAIAVDNTLVVAPEGLNRFYLNGFSGRVGATWMTKEDRLTDIENNHHYLSVVFEQYKTKFPNAKFGIIAFSQGAATAVRWYCHAQPQIQQLIVWSGSFPEDLNWFEDVQKLNKVPLTFVLGNRDEFIDETKLAQQSQFLRYKGLNFNLLRFDGGHDIDLKTLFEVNHLL